MRSLFLCLSTTWFLGGLTAFVWAVAPLEQPASPEIVVPYVPTPEKVVAAMLKLATVRAGDTVYDLGCGDGRIAIAAVRDYQAGKGLGIDFDADRLKDCQKNLRRLSPELQKKLTFQQGDVLKLTEKELAGVDVVTLYMLPDINRRIKPLLRKALQPGARIVSHDFDMGEDWPAEKQWEVADESGFQHTIYLWTIPTKKP
ncbi:MAG: class I SAM-dependent methyltransferase [Bacteroidales bacterium]|nr:class I SAM-dependent methyltransferase [Bacteroidales bacterium]